MNKEVTRFLDDLKHPFRSEIEEIRQIILNSHEEMREGIKWNGPNYSVGDKDRVSIRVHPPKLIQVIFHRGSKVLETPPEKLIRKDYGLLEWRTNDRAIATFKNREEFDHNKAKFAELVKNWLVKTL